MSTTARVVANVKVNGQRHAQGIDLSFDSYREEAIKQWEAHINSLGEEHPQRDETMAEITPDMFRDAVMRVAMRVSREPMIITSNNGLTPTNVVVPQPEYVEVLFDSAPELVLPTRELILS